MEKQSYSPEEADYQFGGMNAVSPEFRIILAKALSELPKATVDWVAENLIFISSSEEYWAFSLSKNEWEHIVGFVFLCEHLKNIAEKEQAFSIAHEIAHHRLGHKSPIFGNLTTDEFRKQEEEADKLARKWLQ